LYEAHEGPGERYLVLDLLHTPDGADHEMLGAAKARVRHGIALLADGPEQRRIHSVHDLRNSKWRDEDFFLQVLCQVTRYGDVLVDERPVQTPHQLAPCIRAIEIVDIAPVLAVDAHRNARERRGNRRIQ